MNKIGIPFDIYYCKNYCENSNLFSFCNKFIADKIEISVESVRKDLSTAYSVLIPAPEPGSDLRISAILKYQNLIGNLGLNEI